MFNDLSGDSLVGTCASGKSCSGSIVASSNKDSGNAVCESRIMTFCAAVEGGREGEREGEREGGRERGREGEREGGREGGEMDERETDKGKRGRHRTSERKVVKSTVMMRMMRAAQVAADRERQMLCSLHSTNLNKYHPQTHLGIWRCQKSWFPLMRYAS